VTGGGSVGAGVVGSGVGVLVVGAGVGVLVVGAGVEVEVEGAVVGAGEVVGFPVPVTGGVIVPARAAAAVRAAVVVAAASTDPAPSVVEAALVDADEVVTSVVDALASGTATSGSGSGRVTAATPESAGWW
jgi:hypothetical protein